LPSGETFSVTTIASRCNFTFEISFAHRCAFKNRGFQPLNTRPFQPAAAAEAADQNQPF
jgi:hypothetical protein